MSGFFGMIRGDGLAVEQRHLDRMAQRLRFRGPDGCHTWANDSVGLCFTFLNTRTRHQASSQPVRLGESYWMIGEVRLDARRELVAELRDNGQPADEQSTDEELLLLSWKVWGQGTLPKILGDFSFAVWDANKETLYCARDFAGARPFYYAYGNGVFCFSNTLEVLRQQPEISADFDDKFIADFLLEGLCDDPERTVWRDVRRLPAGYRLNYSAGKPEVKRFQQLPIEEPLRLKQPEEYLENFRELFRTAVSDRLPEGKVAFYLSGGLDSSAVCATAAQLAAQRGNSRDLKAFTISWRPLMDDPEPQFARQTASYLGLAHELLEEDRILPYERMENRNTPEPTSEVFFGRACWLIQGIGEHARVVLSGDGGDNVLDGQAWPYLQHLRGRGDWSELLRAFGGYFAAHGKFPPLHGGFRTRIQRWFRPEDKPGEMPVWLNEEFSSRVRSQSEMGQTQMESLPVHPLHPHAYSGLHSGYWASVLEEEDSSWTRINLETRAPFLDLRLLRFLLRLPPVPWCARKELTRRAMRGQLPVEILNRSKAPLLQDPLEACQKMAGWRPKVEKNPPKTIERFVKWKSWLATLENSKGLLSWANLYPFSLALWLKGIENGGGIE